MFTSQSAAEIFKLLCFLLFEQCGLCISVDRCSQLDCSVKYAVSNQSANIHVERTEASFEIVMFAFLKSSRQTTEQVFLHLI